MWLSYGQLVTKILEQFGFDLEGKDLVVNAIK